MSPGIKYKHYAPKTKCILVYSKDNDKMVEKINELAQGKDTVILGKTKNLKKYNSKKILDLGNTLEEIARNKYGIITRNGNVITTIDNYKIHIDGKSMVEEICNKKNAKLYLVDKEYSCKNKNDIDDCNKYGINNEDYNIDNNVFEYKHKQYKIRQNGK